jgi:aminoglycoside phosphotransferase (APT) family kinase protein
MPNEQLTWPSEQIDLDAATQWVASACNSDVDAPEILQVKRWGVTARFGSVVLKASFTPLFPQVTEIHALLEQLVPEGGPKLLRSERVDGQLWTLFENIQGSTAEEAGTVEALVATARELARVQAAVAKLDLTGIPVLDVRRIPSILLEDDLSDLPVESVRWLRDAQPSLQDDADALADIPPSLDHPDMNGGNAILLEDGRVLIIDWEEATVGCPLFSLDRLLSDARELNCVEAVRSSYLEAFGEAEAEQLRRAMRLVPLKLAYEFRAYARALNLPTPHSRLTTLLLELAKKRRAGDPFKVWLSDLFES